MQRALEAKDSESLLTVAKDASAPSEIRAAAWTALAQRLEQGRDEAKASDAYISGLSCLTAERSLTAKGYKLRDEAWDQLRFHLSSSLNPQRYRAVLLSWAERTQDQKLLQQLVFELGKMDVLARAETRGAENKP